MQTQKQTHWMIAFGVEKPTIPIAMVIGKPELPYHYKPAFCDAFGVDVHALKLDLSERNKEFLLNEIGKIDIQKLKTKEVYRLLNNNCLIPPCFTGKLPRKSTVLSLIRDKKWEIGVL